MRIGNDTRYGYRRTINRAYRAMFNISRAPPARGGCGRGGRPWNQLVIQAARGSDRQVDAEWLHLPSGCPLFERLLKVARLEIRHYADGRMIFRPAARANCCWRAYSGDCDRLFRPNVTGDSAGSAL